MSSERSSPLRYKKNKTADFGELKRDTDNAAEEVAETKGDNFGREKVKEEDDNIVVSTQAEERKSTKKKATKMFHFSSLFKNVR